MDKPLISICVPTYNGEKFLRECLLSCIKQTYPNFEIIICDDGSSDGTVSIIEEFKLLSHKIKFYQNQRNVGLVDNWNNCIAKSKGEWIKFLFQDDYMTEDCLLEFSVAIDNEAFLLVSKRNFIYDYAPDVVEKEHYLGKGAALEAKVNQTNSKVTAQEISKLAAKNIAVNFIAEPSLTLIRKSAFTEVGNFDASFLQICDLDLLQRIAVRYGLTFIPIQNCFFRLHKDATTNTNIKHRSFILTYLEPLLLTNKMLRSKEYHAFRENIHFLEKARMFLYFNSKLLEAKRESQKSKENTLVFESYLQKHPELNRPVSNGWFHSLILNLVIARRKYLK
jgi:glycosyltransferase involved in cell wall biosynthesis